MNSSFSEYDGGGVATAEQPAVAQASQPCTPSKISPSLQKLLFETTGWDCTPNSPKLKDWKTLVNIRRIVDSFNKNNGLSLLQRENNSEIIVAAVNDMENPPMQREHVRAIPDIERHTIAPSNRAELIKHCEEALASGAFEGPLIVQIGRAHV